MRSLWVGLMFLICSPGLCLGWGGTGHEIVAEIAARQLSPKAKDAIRELLGPDPGVFGEVATWADDIIQERPETYPWHVVRIPPDGVRYDRARDCRNGDCIVEKIKELAKRVGDGQVEASARAEALKFLVHLVGDLHMPLHALAPLNRPVGTFVRVAGTTERLHLWWDYVWWDMEFKERFGFDPMEVAETMVAEISAEQRRAWQVGTSEDWTNESFDIAYDFIVRYDIILLLRDGRHSEHVPIELPDSALAEMKDSVSERLKMAGVRLAWLLNQAFDQDANTKLDP